MAWPKHLSVDKRIVSLLSAATYESFPRALREMVSNSYDADATRVDINIPSRGGCVEVKDNGVGMTPDEFDFFLRIAGQQRKARRKTGLGRTRIGQFGIGFLAMFPFCESVEVESTTRGSSTIFKAVIPTERFLSQTSTKDDVTTTDITGSEFGDGRKKHQQYTILRLQHTNELLRKYLSQHDGSRRNKNSIQSYSGMNRLRWVLEETLPLKFPRDSKIAEYISPDSFNFSVYLNNTQLFAHDYCSDVLDHTDGLAAVGSIKFRYAIGTHWKAIHPDEARGMRVRLHRVGVGPARELFDLGTWGRTFSRLHWLTGEINIVSGLDDAIKIDRDTFTSSADFDEFRDYFRDKLRKQAYYVEEVDESRRKISAQLSHSARAESAPTVEVVQTQVERLRRRGFTVQQDNSAIPKNKPSISVDTSRRVVIVSARNERSSGERISVAGKSWNVKYEKWNVGKDHQRACRIVGSRSIELNREYPLFNGKNKDWFRRLQIILAHADQESTSKRSFYTNIQRLLLKEFS